MLNRDFKEIISAFNAASVDYLIVGAYAVAAHGLPRTTGDIDFWVRPTRENAERVWRALSEFGAPMERVAINDFATPDMIVQFGVPPGRIDVITSVEAVDFAEAWAERLTVAMDGIIAYVIGREHLLRNKRAVGRPQDVADAERLSRHTPLPRAST